MMVLLGGFACCLLFFLSEAAFRQFLGENRLKVADFPARLALLDGVLAHLMASLSFFLGKIDGLRLFFQFVALIFEAHFLFFALLRFEPKDPFSFLGIPAFEWL